MARYATESRACLNEPASTQPVRIFGVMMIMYKVGTPFLLSSTAWSARYSLIRLSVAGRGMQSDYFDQAYGEEPDLDHRRDRQGAPMTLPSSDTPPADVPEADWAEQALEADPQAEAEAEREVGPRPANVASVLREADDADLAEQETVVFVEDDDIR